MDLLKAEAALFAKYLGAEIDDMQLQNRYVFAIQELNVTYKPKDIAIIKSLIQFPFLVSYVDGAFAFIRSVTTVRKRIWIMSALMETEKKYAARFLVQKDISFPFIKFLWLGAKGIVKGFAGILLVYLLRWK